MLKSTPLKRGKPLARTGGLKRSGRLPQKRKGPPRRSSRVIDEAHLRFVRTLLCCAPGCTRNGLRVAHHSTHGRGKSQKVDDTKTMPMHESCHRQLHSLSGPFKGWNQEMLRSWQTKRVEMVHVEKALRVPLAESEVA